MTLEILAWDRHKDVAKFNPVNGIPALPSWKLEFQ